MAQRVHLVPKVRPGLRVQMARMVLMVRQVLPDHRGSRATRARLDRRGQKGRLDLRVRQGLRVPMALKASQALEVPPDPRELMVHLAQLVLPDFKVR
jgi:hypothetical protein